MSSLGSKPPDSNGAVVLTIKVIVFAIYQIVHKDRFRLHRRRFKKRIKILESTVAILIGLQELARTSCTKILSCGHSCGGLTGEDPCLPCLHGCQQSQNEHLKQDGDDMCMICFTEALSAAPAIQVRLSATPLYR